MPDPDNASLSDKSASRGMPAAWPDALRTMLLPPAQRRPMEVTSYTAAPTASAEGEPGSAIALKSRLEERLHEAIEAPTECRLTGEAQALIGDCLTALEAMQSALTEAQARRWQLEVLTFDANATVAQLRSELAGSRAEASHARQLAMHDSLTALPNRPCFMQRLAQAIENATMRNQSLAVFFVDLDGFKTVNDSHGHSAGDELLGIIAARLSRAVRTDDVVGRLGGDEFACLLMGVCDHTQLSRLACKVYDTVSSPIKIGEMVISVHPSIGVAVFPGGGVTAEALLHGADMAMYRAKRELTGYAFFDGDASVRT